jgi:predicted TPR repeat methyltransferase
MEPEFKTLLRKAFLRFLPRFQKDLADCKTILDLGCGYNSPVQYAVGAHKTGVDMFDAYLHQSKEKAIHNEYIKEDITKVNFPPKSFDAVVALDVLEHVSRQEGIALLKKMEMWAKKKVIIHTPNGYLHQEGYDENPLQEHKSGWIANDFTQKGFTVIGMDGLKWLRGHRGQIEYRPAFVWSSISHVSQYLTYFFPSLAFHIYAIKKVS